MTPPVWPPKDPLKRRLMNPVTRRMCYPTVVNARMVAEYYRRDDGRIPEPWRVVMSVYKELGVYV